MNQYPDRAARPHTATPDDALAGHVVQRIEAWAPPSPRWHDSAARARIARTRPTRQQGSTTPSVYQQVKRRFDLVGWLLAQPSDRIVLNDDPSDPRVFLHNRLIAATHRYGGLYANLLHYGTVRA
jgi:hypothetical protein